MKTNVSGKPQPNAVPTTKSTAPTTTTTTTSPTLSSKVVDSFQKTYDTNRKNLFPPSNEKWFFQSWWKTISVAILVAILSIIVQQQIGYDTLIRQSSIPITNTEFKNSYSNYPNQHPPLSPPTKLNPSLNYPNEWNITSFDTEWEPKYGTRCNITRIFETELSAKQFQTEFWRKLPIIIVRRNISTSPQQQQQQQQQQQSVVSFSSIPLTSSISLDAQIATKKSVLLQQHSNTIVTLAGTEGYAFRNETQTTFQKYLQQYNNNNRSTKAYESNFAFATDPFQIGEKYYKVPDVVHELGTELDIQDYTFQLATVVNPGAGLTFHWHGDVFAEVLHGRRRWFLVPPTHSPPFNPRTKTVEWLHTIYPNLLHNQPLFPGDRTSVRPPMSDYLYDCVLEPNEALYVPADWYHAIISLGQAISLTTSFAATYRRERYGGRSDIITTTMGHHSRMLDALGQKDFDKARTFAKIVIKARPYNFSAYAWYGVILTLHVKDPNYSKHHHPSNIVNDLELALVNINTCLDLNPFYAPCHVWLSRLLLYLAEVYTAFKIQPPNHPTVDAMKIESEMAQKKALQLSPVGKLDDELLDPRWQPKGLKK